MEQGTVSEQATPGKRRGERVDKSIFRYHDQNRTEKFGVRLKHKGKESLKAGFSTITKARKWRDSRKGCAADTRLFPEQELAQREQAENRVPFFREYAQAWFEGCRAKRLKHSTLQTYENTLKKHLIPEFGSLRLSEIDRAKVRGLAAKLSVKNKAPKTVHNIIRLLSAIFTQGHEEGLPLTNPARNPAKLVRVPKRGKTEVYTREEEGAILKGVKERLPHYFPFVLLLFRTGMREGEAVALKPKDVDLRSRYALVERNFTAGKMAESPKSGKSRKVDLAHDLADVLKDHLAMQEAEAALTGRPRPEWLFPTPHGDIIRSSNFRDRVWGPLLKQLGLRYRDIHTIRHTFATRMIMAGAPVVYVQKQLGHSSIQMTVDLYTHWIEETGRRSTLEVDRLVAEPGPAGGGTNGGSGRASEREVIEKEEMRVE